MPSVFVLSFQLPNTRLLWPLDFEIQDTFYIELGLWAAGQRSTVLLYCRLFVIVVSPINVIHIIFYGDSLIVWKWNYMTIFFSSGFSIVMCMANKSWYIMHIHHDAETRWNKVTICGIFPLSFIAAITIKNVM